MKPHDSATGRSGVAVLPSVLDAIGSTPVVRLDRLTGGLEGTLLAKLEYLNPGGSKKDRVARQIVLEAEQAGRLQPGQPVVEMTSGNTGAGLAMACAVTGHPFIAVLSKGSSAERARMITALGGEVVLVDQAPGAVPGSVSGADMALVSERTTQIVESTGALRSDQFENSGNADAHYLGTGQELWAQTGGFDAFVDFVGTGGCLAGVTRALKERDPRIRCYAVEPDSLNHPIQGGGFGRDLTHLRGVELDGTLTVSGDEARAMSRSLARKEGIFAGFSAGANVAAALRLLHTNPGITIALVIPDTGLKYLSTDLWEQA